MNPLGPEPQLSIQPQGELPYLVEYWYLRSRVTRHMVVRRFREVLTHADLHSGQRVLDLGCGWAYGTNWARSLGCKVSGIDLGHDQLSWARRAMPGAIDLGLVRTNARQMPYADTTFDRAFSVEMMEHVFRPDRPRVLGEIARVLKPGGRVAISTPNSASPVEVAKHLVMRWPALRNRLPSACFPEATDDPGTYHPYRYHHPLTLDELHGGLEGAGFRVLGVKHFLWIFKTLPDALLAPSAGAEWLAEQTPLLNRLGATTLVWAERAG